MTCYDCNGTRKLHKPVPLTWWQRLLQRPATIESDCPTCRGLGYLMPDHRIPGQSDAEYATAREQYSERLRRDSQLRREREREQERKAENERQRLLKGWCKKCGKTREQAEQTGGLKHCFKCSVGLCMACSYPCPTCKTRFCVDCVYRHRPGRSARTCLGVRHIWFQTGIQPPWLPPRKYLTKNPTTARHIPNMPTPAPARLSNIRPVPKCENDAIASNPPHPIKMLPA